MPILASLLGSLFFSIVSFLAKFLTKKIAILTAVVLAAVALTSAFFSFVSGLFAGIEYLMPAVIDDALCWLLPANTKACVTAYLSARVAAYVYAWNIRILQWKLL